MSIATLNYQRLYVLDVRLMNVALENQWNFMDTYGLDDITSIPNLMGAKTQVIDDSHAFFGHNSNEL